IADDLGVKTAQVALAWVLKNDHVSSAILGVSRIEQLQENIKSLEVKAKLTDGVMKEINLIFE
ncbi:MAG: aldo/keto reductase, partial [Thermotogae bacterium]|nr:aldo/keto reductase [Thermotogota bacterium]